MIRKPVLMPDFSRITCVVASLSSCFTPILLSLLFLTWHGVAATMKKPALEILDCIYYERKKWEILVFFAEWALHFPQMFIFLEDKHYKCEECSCCCFCNLSN